MKKRILTLVAIAATTVFSSADACFASAPQKQTAVSVDYLCEASATFDRAGNVTSRTRSYCGSDGKVRTTVTTRY